MSLGEQSSRRRRRKVRGREEGTVPFFNTGDVSPSLGEKLITTNMLIILRVYARNSLS
jgi:hypothetical protein